MVFNDNTREMRIIEAYHKDKLVGKFVDMHTLTNKLGVLANEVSIKFSVINEKSHETLFWTMIKNGFELTKGR